MQNNFENSILLKLFELEREEILKHKWLLSEKAGRDIGKEKALHSWIKNHREKWLKEKIKELKQE